MSNKEFAAKVREAYDRYFLSKVHANPNSGFVYRSDAVKFIEWLEKETK
jgi:hypothetical protein